MPFDRTLGEVRGINPGSVGMPYVEPGAFWGVLDSRVEFRRTDYDREAAAARIRTARSGRRKHSRGTTCSPCRPWTG
jgi:diadenosine tetraphosphatase ApaH/serine/threonine PP2A family protein phosphatase